MTEPQEKFWDLVEDTKIAMLVTEDGGRLYSRPMAVKCDRETGTLLMVTKKSHPKTGEIINHPECNLAFSNFDDNVYVSVAGKAELSIDKAKIDKAWSPFADAWFDNGKDDPDATVIVFHPHTAEYWDNDISIVKEGWELAKGILTNKKPDMGDNKKVYLQG